MNLLRPGTWLKVWKNIVTAMMVLVLAGFAFVVADEEDVAIDKLPAAVVKAIKEKFPDGKLVSATKDVDGDTTTYEVSLTNKG